ncbi:unnamed protein product [Cylicocyclus nassatus]|uniref:Phosphoglycerate mutase family protein n=1 Tax=Cylicocyclus nassatus TaxID=53992 RepID=A0AA36HAB0_CYLNA|nr:unnamed protein product [Cylicocyclus nassatus]
MSSSFRIVWVVRHAEREDNFNPNWQSLPQARGLADDDPFLSERGRRQAQEVAARFRNIPLAHVFASPFYRTMQTASIVVAGKKILIKPEPGLCEALHHCCSPPGFMNSLRLKQIFPLTDTSYVPVFTKETLPKEPFADNASVPRVRHTFTQITQKYKGDLLFVSHAPPIGAIHEAWNYCYVCVGQATRTLVTYLIKEILGLFRSYYYCGSM